MWLYMVSLYLEAPIETRKRRRPYIIASLVILLLYSTSAIMQGIYTFSVLLEVESGLDNFEEVLATETAFWAKLLKPSGILNDIAIRIADAVLVSSFIFYLECNGELDPALSMLYCLV